MAQNTDRDSETDHLGDFETLSVVDMSDCTVLVMRLPPGGFIGRHYHEKYIDVYTVVEGQVEIEMGSQTLQLGPYESARFEPQIVHGARAIGGSAVIHAVTIPPIDTSDIYMVGETTETIS